MSLLGAEAPPLPELLAGSGIRLLWHPSLSEACGAEFGTLVEEVIAGGTVLDLFCLEGAVLQGPGGTGLFHRGRGGRPVRDLVRSLAEVAGIVVAVGTCAAFGGITGGGGNPAGACGLQYDDDRPGGLLGPDFRSRLGLPVINVAGCPVHPGWVTDLLLQAAAGELTAEGLDAFARPRSYSDHLAHHGCPRNEFYEYKASAAKPSDLGCLMENLGCVGTQARADCNLRLWNGQGSCLRGGYPCIDCTAPGFQEPGHPFGRTPKIAGIPVGLPVDMPKAWFVALAALAKAATPERLRENAHADHLRVAPGEKREKGE